MTAAAPPAATAPVAILGLELVELVSSLLCVLHQGRVTYINPAGLALLGLSSMDEAEGELFSAAIHPDYRFLIEAGWDLLAEEETALPLKMFRKGGELFEAELTVKALPRVEDTFLIEIRDITRFRRAAEGLREREERIQGILRSVADGIVTVNEDSVIDSVNPAAEKIFGYEKCDLLGRDISMLMPQPHQAEHAGYVSSYKLTGKAHVLGRVREMVGKRKDGSIFPMELTVTEVRHGKHRLFTGIVRDISERKAREEEVRRLAHHDSLTGLPNRNLLNDRLAQAMARARRNGGQLAIMFVDLDKFKPINDSLGHEAGDAVLIEIAKRLHSALRASDTVARIGGDEFVVVLEGISQPGEAAFVARKILDSLLAPIPFGQHLCQVGASIGIALFPDDGSDADAVWKAADLAMYKVKEAGRNSYRFAGDRAG